jgi:hypothetical protein
MQKKGWASFCNYYIKSFEVPLRKYHKKSPVFACKYRRLFVSLRATWIITLFLIKDKKIWILERRQNYVFSDN